MQQRRGIAHLSLVVFQSRGHGRSFEHSSCCSTNGSARTGQGGGSLHGQGCTPPGITHHKLLIHCGTTTGMWATPGGSNRASRVGVPAASCYLLDSGAQGFLSQGPNSSGFWSLMTAAVHTSPNTAAQRLAPSMTASAASADGACFTCAEAQSQPGLLFCGTLGSVQPWGRCVGLRLPETPS